MSRRRFMRHTKGTTIYTQFYFVNSDNLYFSPEEVSKMNSIDKAKIKGYAIGRLNYLVSSTTPVFNRDNSGMGRIISLKTVTGSSWGWNGRDVSGLYNFPSGNEKSDYDGKTNTGYIATQGVARLCQNYNPGYKNGEWYLPSAGELFFFWQNKERIKSDFDTAGVLYDIKFSSPSDVYIDYWTSTENDLSNAFYFNAWYERFEPGSKNYNSASNFKFYAIPFLLMN